MELRSCRLAVLNLHMVPAWCRCIVDAVKQLFQLLERDPVGRIVRMVIIAIHHDDIGLKEVNDTAVVVLELTAYMVKTDCCLQIFPGADFCPVRVKTVLGIGSHVCRL